MEIVLWLIVVLAGMALGALIGHGVNRMYLDERPNEELGFWMRSARLFFFPAAYHSWSMRGRLEEATLRQVCGAGWKNVDNHKVEIPKKNLRMYSIALMVLWPIKMLVNLFIFVIQMIWLCAGLIRDHFYPRTKTAETSKTNENELQSECATALQDLGRFMEVDLCQGVNRLHALDKSKREQWISLDSVKRRWDALQGPANSTCVCDYPEGVRSSVRQAMTDLIIQRAHIRGALIVLERVRVELGTIANMLRAAIETEQLLSTVWSDTADLNLRILLNAIRANRHWCMLALDLDLVAFQGDIDLGQITAEVLAETTQESRVTH